MSRSPSIGHRAEYYTLRGAVAALERMPFYRAASLGERIGALGYRPLGIRRRVVERQVAAAFPGLPDAEVRDIARAAYRHLGRTAIETALMPSLGRQEILALVESVDNWSTVERAMAGGKGCILVTGHLGNWELGGAYLAARGIAVEAIVRRMGNPLFDRYLNETRARYGVSVVYDTEAARQIPRSLRENRLVAFLADQGVLGLASTFVPFFGRPAKTPRGAAVFALRLGVPAIFGAAIRQPGGRYRLSFETIMVEDTGDRERDVDTIVARYTETLERWVRRAPEQYFWHHRRWRRQPPDTPLALREPA
ncbi:MAG TPA: lysophospholipid acyltransferase family protein [Gemmatimonadaceae bacterium]|nr:lysophospholipid acyltransferase family protein [Gemmatimonadaceae bacterium]